MKLLICLVIIFSITSIFSMDTSRTFAAHHKHVTPQELLLELQITKASLELDLEIEVKNPFKQDLTKQLTLRKQIAEIRQYIDKLSNEISNRSCDLRK